MLAEDNCQRRKVHVSKGLGGVAAVDANGRASVHFGEEQFDIAVSAGCLLARYRHRAKLTTLLPSQGRAALEARIAT